MADTRADSMSVSICFTRSEWLGAALPPQHRSCSLDVTRGWRTIKVLGALAGKRSASAMKPSRFAWRTPSFQITAPIILPFPSNATEEQDLIEILDRSAQPRVGAG